MDSNSSKTWALSRRQILQIGAAGVAASALDVSFDAEAIAGASPAPFVPLTKPVGPRPNTKVPIGTDLIPQIKNIVIVMMENQSYDSVLGMLSNPSNQAHRGDGLTWNQTPSARALNTNPITLGAHSPVEQSFAMPTTAQMDNYPWQTWDATWTQFLGSPTAQSISKNPAALNQGFVISQSGPIAMGYFTPTQLPFINSLAQTFPIADRWHCSAPGQTYPNRMFMMAGTSLGLTTTTLPSPNLMPTNGTIFQALTRYGITWKNYYCDSPSSLIWLGQLLGPHSTANFSNNLFKMSTFFSDCANGTLPSVSLVDPNYGTSSGENPQDLQHADAFLHDVITAVMSGPKWQETLVVWTFDEHGGWYDHVPPVFLGRPDNSKPSSQLWAGNPKIPSFDYSGMRVPSGVVSAYAKPDYVSTTLYDHTSILKLIEEKWNLPPFTSRDKNANSPLDMVDFTKKPTFATPPPLAPKVRDRAGNVVSTGIGTDTALTADELTYPDNNTFVPGNGYLSRREFYTDKNGNSTGVVTPYFALLQSAWATPGK